MIVGALVVLGLLYVLLRRRADRKDQRAGLDGDRPAFSIEPPHRRLGSRSREQL